MLYNINIVINIMKSFIYILIIIFFLGIIINNLKSNYEYFDLTQYQTKMLNNNKEKLFKIGFDKNIEIRRNDCFYKCNKTDCIKLDEMGKILDKCRKCNITHNKCFRKSIIGGNCDDCDEANETKINCNDIINYGCPNPTNIDSNDGIDPYYIQLPDNNINSPYNEKCVFCWNISSDI